MAAKLNKVVVDGLMTEYLELGRGPVVLLLHGWGQNATGFLPLAEPLSKRFSVVVPSLPGFGGSSEPKSVWSPADYATFLAAFLQKTALLPQAAIGHSFGGQVLAHLLTDEKSSSTDKIAESTMQKTGDFARSTIQKIVFIDAAGVHPGAANQGRIRKIMEKPREILKKSASLRKLIVRLRGSDDYQAASPLMREVLKRTVNEDLSAVIPTIRTKCLIVWGDQDSVTPPNYASVFAQIPSSRLEVIPGAGHFPFLDAPERVAGIIMDFLK